MYRASSRDGESDGSSEKIRSELLLMRPSPDTSLPMMSLLRTASIISFSLCALRAYRALPISPSSSAVNAINTIVLSHSYWLITRASSITAAVPDPSSVTPGAFCSDMRLSYSTGSTLRFASLPDPPFVPPPAPAPPPAGSLVADADHAETDLIVRAFGRRRLPVAGGGHGRGPERPEEDSAGYFCA